MPDSVILCGQQLGLPIFRHRRFESWPFLILGFPHQKHIGVCASGHYSMGKRYATSHIGIVEISRMSIAGHGTGFDWAQTAMGIDWMTRAELTQAIPPAYTHFIGQYLLQALAGAGAPSVGERWLK